MNRSVSRVKVVLRPDEDGKLDDVMVRPVRMFRAERMSDGDLWMACYTGGTDPTKWEETRFWVRAVKKGVLEFVVTDAPRHAEYERGSLLAPVPAHVRNRRLTATGGRPEARDRDDQSVVLAGPLIGKQSACASSSRVSDKGNG